MNTCSIAMSKSITYLLRHQNLMTIIFGDKAVLYEYMHIFVAPSNVTSLYLFFFDIAHDDDNSIFFRWLGVGLEKGEQQITLEGPLKRDLDQKKVEELDCEGTCISYYSLT